MNIPRSSGQINGHFDALRNWVIRTIQYGRFQCFLLTLYWELVGWSCLLKQHLKYSHRKPPRFSAVLWSEQHVAWPSNIVHHPSATVLSTSIWLVLVVGIQCWLISWNCCSVLFAQWCDKTYPSLQRCSPMTAPECLHTVPNTLQYSSDEDYFWRNLVVNV